jgi:hypothetical protein
VCRLEKCDADYVAVANPWDTVIKLAIHRNWALDWPGDCLLLKELGPWSQMLTELVCVWCEMVRNV